MQPPPSQYPSNYPRPDLSNDRQILREIATSQRQVIYCVLAQIVLVVLNMVLRSAPNIIVAIVFLVLGVALLVYTISSVARLAKSLGESAVLYIILMFIPCVSLIMLLMLSGKANTRLSAAGVKVGMLGADPNSI